MIKKEKKTSVQYCLTKSWNTGSLAYAVLHVRRCVVCLVCVCVCVPWPNRHHGFWRSESCSSGSVFILVHYLSFVPSPVSPCCVSSVLPGSFLSPTRGNSSVAAAAAHTLLLPVKLPITITASPASLTGLLNRSHTGCLCSGFLCLESSPVRVRERWKGEFKWERVRRVPVGWG